MSTYYLTEIIRKLDVDGQYAKEGCYGCNVLYKPDPTTACAFKGCKINFCMHDDCSPVIPTRFSFQTCINEEGNQETRCEDHTHICTKCGENSTTKVCSLCNDNKRSRVDMLSEMAHTFGYKLKKIRKK